MSLIDHVMVMLIVAFVADYTVAGCRLNLVTATSVVISTTMCMMDQGALRMIMSMVVALVVVVVVITVIGKSIRVGDSCTGAEVHDLLFQLFVLMLQVRYVLDRFP